MPLFSRYFRGRKSKGSGRQKIKLFEMVYQKEAGYSQKLKTQRQSPPAI